MPAVSDSSQSPLFDVRHFMPKPYDEWSFFGVLERFGHLIIRRDDFPPPRPLEAGGELPWCPVLLTKLELMRQKHGWTDREAVQAANTDMRVKACLGLGLDQAGPSQPTLCRHRQLMASLGLDEVYMKRFVQLMQVLELLGQDEAVLVDSTPVDGAGQVLDTYNLLAAATRRGLQHLARSSGEQVAVVAERLGLTRYLARSVKGSFDIEWDDAKQRATVLTQLVADALRVREALAALQPKPDVSPPLEQPDPPDGPSDGQQPLLPGLESEGGPAPTPPAQQDADRTTSVELVALIDDVIEHAVERAADGCVRDIVQRAAGDRPISATDPNMRHGRKSASVLIAGYKAQLVTSVLYAWLLVSVVVRANRHDGKDLPDLVQRLVGNLRLRPAWLGGDHAYGTLSNHHFFQERLARGEPLAELIARMPRPSNGGRYTKDEFTVDLDARTLHCPAGLVCPARTSRRGGKSGWLFEFDPAACAGCPLRKACVSPKASQDVGRSVFVVPSDERLIRKHLQERTEPPFRAKLDRRSLVERAIAGFAQCGGKQARRFGQRNVDFDVRLSALAYNFRRLGAVAASDPLVVDRLARVVVRPRSDRPASTGSAGPSPADRASSVHTSASSCCARSWAWCSRLASTLTALVTRLMHPAAITRYLTASCA